MLTPPDPPAQLVELRQAEAFGVFDNHHRGVGDVHADLDDGGRDQQVELAPPETLHYLIFFGAEHLAVEHLDAAAFGHDKFEVFEHLRGRDDML